VNCGVLLLAAGRAVRFGADKRLARLRDGRTVIGTTLDNIRGSGLPLLVCLAEGDDELARCMDEMDMPWLPCRRAGEGMGGTLAEGVLHIPDWDGVIVALADMPWIAPATYSAVAGQLAPRNIVAPVHGGRRGHPVGFGRQFYPALAALGGDTGARSVLALYAASVAELPVPDAAIHRDIDLPADLP
jgi:molybdenum cofactor cytidylyltransferase